MLWNSRGCDAPTLMSLRSCHSRRLQPSRKKDTKDNPHVQD